MKLMNGRMYRDTHKYLLRVTPEAAFCKRLTN